MQERSRVGTETAGRAVPDRVPLPPLLRMFWLEMAVAFGLTFLVGFLRRHGSLMPHWYPWGYPVFADLKEYPAQYRLLHTAGFFSAVPSAANLTPNPVAYPPFAAVVLAALYAVSRPEYLYVAVLAVWLGIAVWALRRRMMVVGIAGGTALLFLLSLVVMPFPIVRLLNEGNVELVLWIFTATGTWAFLRGRDGWAAGLWGLAAAMKLYPVVLLILLLPRRRFAAFAGGVLTIVGATVMSLAWLGPSLAVAWHGSVQNVFVYQGLRAGEWDLRELVANHSAFGLVKFAAMIARVPQAKLTLVYYGAGAVILAAAFFGKLWKMPAANQVLAVSVFMVTLPTVSYYHTLIHLYAPLLMLVFLAIRVENAGLTVPRLKATILLFVPLFAPFTILTFPRALVFCGLVQAVLLLVLFLRATEYPLEVVDG